MLALMVTLLWASDLMDSVNSWGSVFEFVGWIVAGMNAPALVVVWLFGWLLMDHLPVVVRVPLVCGLFWVSWHFILRFLLWRARLEGPIVFKLSD